MILFRDRAATILYEVLLTLPKSRKFLLPLNVCPIVPDTFLKAGIQFDFIDIDLATLCMDEQLALKALKNDKYIGGVLFVKTFGIEVGTDVFYQKMKCINPDIFIIDDQCLSVPNFDIDPNDSLASLTLFSSGYAKYVDIDYGGFGFLKDSDFEGLFRDNSFDKSFVEYCVDVSNRIPIVREHKAKLNLVYRKNIPSSLHLGKAFENWRFSILVDNKDQLLEKIFNEDNLFASSHYAPIDSKYVDNPAQHSNAQEVFSNTVNFFNDFRFTEEKALRITRIVNDFIR